MSYPKVQSPNSIRTILDKTYYKESNRNSASSLRIPEIQMISKFYGLIPKKFAISERVQPTVSLIRQKSFARPKTGKPLRSSSPDPDKYLDTINRTNLRRYSSLDNSDVIKTSETPLLTKKITFEKATAKQAKQLEQKVEQNKESIPEDLLNNHRILKIDLNQIRKDERQTKVDEDHEIFTKEGYFSDSDVDDPNSNNKHSKIQKNNLEEENDAEVRKFPIRPTTACPRILTCTSNASRTQTQEIPDSPKPSKESAHWTLGKTTAERRSKLQKAFSIHPSFNFSSFDGAEESLSETPSEFSFSYPSSMTRTGRRALHVEELPEVDTLVGNFSKKHSRSQSKSLDDSHSKSVDGERCQMSIHRLLRKDSQQEFTAKNTVDNSKVEHVPIIKIPYNSSLRSSNETLTKLLKNNETVTSDQNPTLQQRTKGLSTNSYTKISNIQNIPKQNDNIPSKKPQPVLKKSNSITATEKRKVFSNKSVSLPSLNESHGRGSKNQRSQYVKRPASTLTHANGKSEKIIKDIKTNLSDHGKKSFNGNHKSMSMSNRPKTAPSPIKPTNLIKSSRNKVSEQEHMNWNHKKIKRQDPSSRILSVPNPIRSTSKLAEEVSIVQEQNFRTIWRNNPNSHDKPTSPLKPLNQCLEPSEETNCESRVKKSEESDEMEAKHPPLPEQVKIVPRRSFSLDQGSLLSYSTSIAQSIDSIENSLQNSKKREECLKIYEKMLKQGSPIRLQTIFRGMMTPSEYRTFISAAEKAATTTIEDRGQDNGPENQNQVSFPIDSSPKDHFVKPLTDN